MGLTDERLGVVRLSLPDGRAVPIRFSWARIDAMGRSWIVDAFGKMVKGEPGCQAAMADMLVLTSGGEIQPADVLSEEGDVVGFEPAFKALEDAWLIARFGPTRRPAEDGSENPRKSRPTWWRRCFRLRSKRE